MRYYFVLQNIWAYLGENNVPVKSLVAALSFFVLTGKNKKAKVEQRLNSLHAASLYLLLLGMPGEKNLITVYVELLATEMS